MSESAVSGMIFWIIVIGGLLTVWFLYDRQRRS